MTSFKNQILSLRKNFLSFCPSIIWPKYIEYDGALIPLRSLDTSFGNKYLLYTRQYELPERILASQFVEKGMSIVEIGASIGILSSYLTKLTGLTGKVIALEGSQRKYCTAKQWCTKLYPNLFFENSYGLPIWSTKNTITISEIEDSISTLGGRPHFSRLSNHQVPQNLLSLEDISSKYKLSSIDALVIDIEGSEEEMLSHDLNLPHELKYILIELHPHAYSLYDITSKIINKICLSGFDLMHNIDSSYLFRRTT